MREHLLIKATTPHPNLFQNHPSGQLGGWEMLWSAEDMLYGQCQRVVIPALSGTAYDGLPQKSVVEDFC